MLEVELVDEVLDEVQDEVVVEEVNKFEQKIENAGLAGERDTSPRTAGNLRSNAVVDAFRRLRRSRRSRRRSACWTRRSRSG